MSKNCRPMPIERRFEIPTRSNQKHHSREKAVSTTRNSTVILIINIPITTRIKGRPRSYPTMMTAPSMVVPTNGGSAIRTNMGKFFAQGDPPKVLKAHLLGHNNHPSTMDHQITSKSFRTKKEVQTSLNPPLIIIAFAAHIVTTLHRDILHHTRLINPTNTLTNILSKHTVMITTRLVTTYQKVPSSYKPSTEKRQTYMPSVFSTVAVPILC